MLRVYEVFDSIQGEGVLTGIPMCFVRFSGCNLRCPGCDTPYSLDNDAGIENSVDDVMKLVSPTLKWVCLTGGEPFMQPYEDLDWLITKLKMKKYHIAVETNGTCSVQSPTIALIDWLCVSPKTRTMSKAAQPILKHADEIKLVWGSQHLVTRHHLREQITYIRTRNDTAVISLQPWAVNGEPTLDEIHQTVQVCKEFNLRLSVQVHKMIGVH